MRVLVDATTLIALGQIGELNLLTCLSGELEIPEEVRSEVSTEPASTNLKRLLDHQQVASASFVGGGDLHHNKAKQLLNEDKVNGDLQIITRVISAANLPGVDVGVVSDDQRVRTVARGLGATVTGTVGVIVRAVEERDMTADKGKEFVRRVDSHGLHMTGELREKAYELVEEAAENE